MPGYLQFKLVDLRDQCYERLGNNQAFWRVDELNRYIREGLKIINVLTGFWRGSYDMGGTVAGAAWYAVPPQFNYLLRVLVNNYPLGDSKLWDLDQGRPGWEAETGTPAVWAPAGFNQFVVWPQSADGGEPLIVEGVTPAPQPVADDEYVDMGKEQISMLVDYVEHIAQFKEGGEEFKTSLQRYQSFMRAAAQRNSLLMESNQFRSWMGLQDDAGRKPRRTPARVGAR